MILFTIKWLCFCHRLARPLVWRKTSTPRKEIQKIHSLSVSLSVRGATTQQRVSTIYHTIVAAPFPFSPLQYTMSETPGRKRDREDDDEPRGLFARIFSTAKKPKRAPVESSTEATPPQFNSLPRLNLSSPSASSAAMNGASPPIQQAARKSFRNVCGRDSD